MNQKRFIGLCALLLIVSGCATGLKSITQVNQSTNDLALAELTHWTLGGRMAFISERDKISAYVRWHQQHNEFEFTMTNILGVTLLVLSYDGALATLVMDGETYIDTDPQQLLLRVSGWHIPVNRFPNWIKGLATREDLTERNEKGLLTHIVTPIAMQEMPQNTLWEVQYEQYTAIDTVVLPKQLNVAQQTHNILIKLKINEWQLN